MDKINNYLMSSALMYADSALVCSRGVIKSENYTGILCNNADITC